MNQYKFLILTFMALLLFLCSYNTACAGVVVESNISLILKNKNSILVHYTDRELSDSVDRPQWDISKFDYGMHPYSLQTTRPYPVALTYHPLYSVGITATVQPTNTLSTPFPSEGHVYVRYGIDTQHWSTWIPLPRSQDKEGPIRFGLSLEVPTIQRKSFMDYQRQFSQLNTPPTYQVGDTLDWIQEQDPQFLENNIPFIGYLQFLYETDETGADEIDRIDITIMRAYGGMIPYPPSEKANHGPWKYIVPAPKK